MMKNRKKIYTKLVFILTIVSTTLTFWSCDGFLDESSESQRVMNQFYNNKKELEAGLLGVYGKAKMYYQGLALPVTILGTDELYASSTTGNQGIVDRYLYPASNPSTTRWYSNHYDVIQGANIIINRAPSVPGLSEADKNMIIAEAKVIRAWSYFRLVQTFGRISLELDETTDFHFRIRRYPIAEVYQAIIDDLKFAAEDEVLTENIVTGRINHWVAKGLLAKVYLTIGTSMTRRPQPIDEYRELPFDPLQLFEACRDICDEIIASNKYSLENSYGDIFLINNKNGIESMWELQFSSYPQLGSGWSKEFGLAQMYFSNAYTVNCMVGRGNFCPLPSFYRYFKLGDSRRTWSIADYRIEFDKNTYEPVRPYYIGEESISDVSGEKCNLDTDDPDWLLRSLNSTPAGRLRVSKYRWGTGSDPSQYWKETMSFQSNNTPNNVIILRYADVLLMRIEADMLSSQGVASDRSIEIMNNQLLARARGWNQLSGKHITEEEMTESILAPYQELINIAQAAYDADPSDPLLAQNLQNAKNEYEFKKGRCLLNYTKETLTYNELMTQRACELCFELHRWFDLSRTGQLHKVVPERIVNPNNIPKVSFRFEANYLLPIPTYELDLAEDKTLFYQNPGY